MVLSRTSSRSPFLKGLTEETVRAISAKKNEPPFMLEFRLKAFQKWKEMKEPEWANIDYPPIDYQNISYYSAPKKKQELNSLDEVDPEILKTFERLGIPLDEQKRLANVAVDVVFDSVSLGTTFQKNTPRSGRRPLLHLRSGPQISGARRKILRQRRSDRRQLFYRAQFRRIF